MRHGHRHRLKCEHGHESISGPSTFARSVGSKHKTWHSLAETGTKGVLVKRRTNKFSDSCDAMQIEKQLRHTNFSELFSGPACAEWDDDDQWQGLNWSSLFAYAPCSKLQEEEQLQKAIVESLHETLGVVSRLLDSMETNRREACASHTIKTRAALWEEAEAKAKSSAEKYASSMHPEVHKVHPTKPERAAIELVQPALAQRPSQIPFKEPPEGAGEPRAPKEHSIVAEMAAPGKHGAPCCWEAGLGRNKIYRHVKHGCNEYEAVTGYFLRTVNRTCEIIDCIRLQNPNVHKQYDRQGGETIMFHGCGSGANEASIIDNGFQVTRCVSGGPGFGTWFAYDAAYSDAGYVFSDQSGLRHIFVCAVSYKHTVMDNVTMRVVGHGCAYPLWLLTYKIEHTPTWTFKKAEAGRPRPATFFEVRDGRWVAVPTK